MLFLYYYFFPPWTGLKQVLKYNSECLNQCKGGLMGSLISRWQNSSVSFGDFQSRSDIVQEKRVCASLTWWNWLKKLYSVCFRLHPSIFCKCNEENCSIRWPAVYESIHIGKYKPKLSLKKGRNLHLEQIVSAQVYEYCL